MVIRHGIDLVECRRIANMLEKHGQRFLERVLSPGERDIVARLPHPTTFIAGRWAAKEALLKMIGTGWRGGICWTDMEILPDELGRPVVRLIGETERIARELGLVDIQVSITHTKENAAASAIGVGSTA